MSDDHSQLGAAPATLFKCDNCGAKYPQRHNGWDTERCIRCGRVTHQPDAPAAPAQPDARDAEIARLERRENVLEQQAARLTKELEEARAALTEADEGENVALRARNAAGAQAKALREALEALERDFRAVVASALDRAAEARSDAAKYGDWSLVDRASARALAYRACANRIAAILAPPEPKAETPAETAGQKEGL